MKQSKSHSLIEVLVNYMTGFGIAYLTFQYIVPVMFNIEPSHGQSIGVTVLFTVISVVRSYIVRRFFDWHWHRDKT